MVMIFGKFSFYFELNKFRCDCCNMFVGNTPNALNKHFSSNKHKFNLQKSITKKRKEKGNDMETQKEIRKLEMVKIVSFSIKFLLIL